MTQIWIQKAFAPFKRWFPGWIARPVRGFATALLTPLLFSYRTGHFRSSLLGKAVKKNGEPLPWYTYPSIDFLKHRSFVDKSVLEFGAGQSTLWWAKRAQHVLALEANKGWYEKIAGVMPRNVELHLVSTKSRADCVAHVEKILGESPRRYDVVVIDWPYRYEMAGIARTLVTEDGLIICDDAELHGMYEAFKNSGLSRVDFYGYAPGVVLPHATSVFFKPGSSFFGAGHGISVVAREP